MKKKKTRRTWSADELAFLDANYKIIGVVACADKLNRHTASVNSKAKTRDLIDENYYYSEAEVDFIRKNANKGIVWLSKKMNRTHRSIGRKSREYGISISMKGGVVEKRKPWTDNENAMLINSKFSNEDLALKLGRSKQAIATQKCMLKRK